MKSTQIGTNKVCVPTLHYGKGVGQHHLHLAESQRGVGGLQLCCDWRVLVREAAVLTRSRVSYEVVWGAYLILLSLLGPDLEVGQILGKPAVIDFI